jgi:hypothetical protein
MSSTAERLCFFKLAWRLGKNGNPKRERRTPPLKVPPFLAQGASGYQNTLRTIDLCLGAAVKNVATLARALVYVVENKCFPPSGERSVGIKLCREEGYIARKAILSSWVSTCWEPFGFGWKGLK